VWSGESLMDPILICIVLVIAITLVADGLGVI
jgi:hypothetical protein